MKTILPAQRVTNLSENYFSTLSSQIRKLEQTGRKVIRLDIGSPDLPPPQSAVQQLQLAAEKPTNHGYQAHQGIPSLRKAWASYYHHHHGISLDPETQILPLIGSKEGIFHLSLALIEPGDVVLIPDPGYQTYTKGAQFSGGTPEYISCDSGDDFLASLGRISDAALEKAKLLWANFPHNPTGAAIDRDQARQLVDFSRGHGLVLCHDAAYIQVTYDGYSAPSLLETAREDDPVVEFNSLSKSHNMAGWRLGVLVGNAQVIQKLYALKTHADSGHFRPAMSAGAAVLQGEDEWVKARNLRYQERRNLVASGLQSLGLPLNIPRGGIYLWFPIPAGLTSNEFAARLLQNYQVALTPGRIFGPRGEGYLRLSITCPDDLLREGLDRLLDGYYQMMRSEAG